VCAPADETGFSPNWHPPISPTSVCTNEQMDAFFTGCISDTATSATCARFVGNPTPADGACGACLTSPPTAARYGALVVTRGLIELNTAGCLALFEGKTNGSGCGGSFQAQEQCENAACSACDLSTVPFDEYQMCLEQAGASTCKAFADAANACTDAVRQMDGGAVACLDFASFQDGYRAYASIFCGGGAPDAGH
jgi:hypothetical protein